MSVENSHQVTFQNNVELELQQGSDADNMLSEAVVWTNDSGSEKVKAKDIFAAKKAKTAKDRNGRTIWDDPTSDGVWIPKEEELYEAILIENADKLSTSISLEGASTQVTAATLRRARMQRILEGFYNPIISGKKGTVSTPLGSLGQVAADIGGSGAALPLNTKKLRTAKTYLDGNFVAKGQKRYMVVTAEDCDALLDEVPATSTDFQKSFGAEVDEDGTLKRMLGFHFIHVELEDPLLDTIPELADDGAGNRVNPFWVKGGLAGNYWQMLRSRVGEIAELRFNLGTFGGTTLAATRTQAGRCGTILNKRQ